MKKNWCGLLCLSLTLLLAACGSPTASQSGSSHSLANSASNHSNLRQISVPTPTPTPGMVIPSQKVVSTPKPSHGSSSSSSGCIAFSNDTTRTPAKNGGLAAPYGSAPTSSQAQSFATQIFNVINHDRIACGLPAFGWSSTLASGALLHSWNMAHCGFSHTCPDGMSPCQRIANEGFGGSIDCGECIGGAGGTWSSVYSIQEGMEHEPVTGWHRIHLFSTTLHLIGIGVYIDSGGYVWFTEDLVS